MALATLMLAAFIFVTTESLPIGLLLEMSAALRVPTSSVGLLVTAYALLVVVATIPLTRVARGLPRHLLMPGLLAGFGVASVASAVAPDYRVLFVARLLTALVQALFWALVLPTASALFAPRVRGRALAVVQAGSSLAIVLGVPAGTWLGQRAGWRAPFLGLAVLGLLLVPALARSLPRPATDGAARTTDDAEERDDRRTPDPGRYRALVLATVLGSTGAFVSYTYVTGFLTGVSGLPAAALGPVLLVRGVFGLVGVGLGGYGADRRPWSSMCVVLAVQALALLGLFAVGDRSVPAVIFVATSGLTFAAFTSVLGARLLEVAPGSPELGAAGISTGINVGITGGAFLGSLLPPASVRGTALLGGLFSVVALGVGLVEPRLASRPRTRPAAGPGAARPVREGELLRTSKGVVE